MAIIGSFCGTLLAVAVVAFLAWLEDEFAQVKGHRHEDQEFHRRRR